MNTRATKGVRARSVATVRGTLRCGAHFLGIVALAAWGLTALAEEAAAQEGAVAGQVVSAADLNPLEGVQVFVVGTDLGTLTNEEGRYLLAGIPVGTVEVRVRIIGYTTVTRAVRVIAGETADLDFELEVTAVSLDELVVTTTGEQRRREVANAVSGIAADEITDVAPLQNLTELIQGRASGVSVQRSSGVTGTGSRIRIRGNSSVSLDNAPLVYIDGARVSSDETGSSLNIGGQTISRLDDLNPEEIESIEIVKGPSAATLYGTQAANGVIRITTKKGRGRTRAHFWVEGGITEDNNDYPGLWRAVDASGQHCPLVDQGLGQCTIDDVEFYNLLLNPETRPFKTGNRYQVGGSVSGAPAGVTYYLSGEYEHEDGTLPNNELDRKVSLRGNVGIDPRNNLSIDVSTGFVTSSVRLTNNDNSSLGIQAQGLLGSDPSPDGWWRFTPQQLFLMETWQDVNRFTGSAIGLWDALPWLQVRASGGVDLVDGEDSQFIPPGEIPRGRDVLGNRTVNRIRSWNWTAELNATAGFDLTAAIRSETSVGTQFYHQRETGTLGFGEELVAGTKSLSAAAATTVGEFTTESKTIGAYLQEQVAFNDRLFLTGAVRMDDNSAFGDAFDVVVYPKFSASWVLSEEPFFPTPDWLSSLRFRAAYGQSGNQPGVTDALLFLTGRPVTTSDAEDAIGVTFAGGGLGNPNLKPERSWEVETGIDASLLDDRVTLDLTYYDKTTEDALIFRNVAPSVGTVEGRFENLGKTTNRGIEFSVLAQILDVEDFGLDLAISGSRNTNELVELGEGVAPIGGSFRQQEGFPLGSYFERPILDFDDANGDGIIVPDEVVVGDTAVFLGTATPKTELSIRPVLTLFERLQVNALFDYRGGHRVANNTESFRCGRANQESRNSPGASLADQARCVASFFYDTDAGYIEDGAFMKLREVSLTLSAPAAWAQALGAEGLRLTLAGRNLLTWTDYTGVDPEINRQAEDQFQSVEFLTQAPTTYWIARVNVNF